MSAKGAPRGRDEARLHEVLRDPSLVEDIAEDAMTGDADADGYQDDDAYQRRFEGRPDGAAVLTR